MKYYYHSKEIVYSSDDYVRMYLAILNQKLGKSVVALKILKKRPFINKYQIMNNKDIITDCKRKIESAYNNPSSQTLDEAVNEEERIVEKEYELAIHLASSCDFKMPATTRKKDLIELGYTHGQIQKIIFYLQAVEKHEEWSKLTIEKKRNAIITNLYQEYRQLQPINSIETGV